jgi:4-amino-4-deoxy-L-arabinose transferase-like glycosyltransferase
MPLTSRAEVLWHSPEAAGGGANAMIENHQRTKKMPWTPAGAHYVLQIRAMMMSDAWKSKRQDAVLSAPGAMDKIYHSQLRLFLVLGIAIRVTVFLFQAPFDNDKHFAVVQYVFQTSKIPIADQLDQAYQPPLYYLLASPLLFRGVAKVVQVLSLALSLATLLVFYTLLNQLDFPSTPKQYSFLLLCFLPQLIMFQNYISNDTLAIFIGALIFLHVHRYLSNPHMKNIIIISILIGLGLLTKATFLAFIIPIFLLIIITRIRQRKSAYNIFLSLVLFSIIFVALGSYKFIQSYLYLGNAFFCNIDLHSAWVGHQKNTYQGLASFLDVNLIKLARYPTVSEKTKHSYPLMFYGTFWYQYIPESNFKGNLSWFRMIGSLIYMFAAIPTSTAVIGLFSILVSYKKLLHIRQLTQEEFKNIVFQYTSSLLFIMNLSLIVYAGMKYDVWSIFQARLFFPSILGIIVCLNSGIMLLERFEKLKRCIKYSLLLLVSLFIMYFFVEIAIYHPIQSAGWHTPSAPHGPPVLSPQLITG